MTKLSLNEKYSIDEIAKELNISKRLSNGMRKHFGDFMSLYELSKITRSDFYSRKGLGLKSWREFSKSISVVDNPQEAVKIIGKPSLNKIVVEIDFTKSFSQVIYELSDMIKKSV